MRRLTLAVSLVGLVVAAVSPASASASVDAGHRVTRDEIRKLREAAQRTLDAGPRAYEVEVLVQIPEDPPNPDRTIQPFRAEGLIDPGTGTTTATLEVLSEEFGDVPDTTLEVKALSGETSFVQSDAFTLPPGKEWVEVPTARLANAASTTTSLLYLSEFVGRPRFIGESDDGDAVVRKYAVDVPVRTIVEAGGVPSSAAVERDLRRLERAGRGTAICNLSIDSDGRIQSFATYLQLAARGDGPELDVLGQFSDYGTDIFVAVPPPEQVAPLDSVADQLEPFLGPIDG